MTNVFHVILVDVMNVQNQENVFHVLRTITINHHLKKISVFVNKTIIHSRGKIDARIVAILRVV